MCSEDKRGDFFTKFMNARIFITRFFSEGILIIIFLARIFLCDISDSVFATQLFFNVYGRLDRI